MLLPRRSPKGYPGEPSDPRLEQPPILGADLVAILHACSREFQRRVSDQWCDLPRHAVSMSEGNHAVRNASILPSGVLLAF